MGQTTLRYEDLTIGVGASDSSDIAWLEEFFVPCAEIVRSGSVDCTVSLTVDTGHFQRTQHEGPHSERGDALCFTLDRRDLRHPIWRSTDGELLIFDEELEVFYRPRERDAHIDILATTNRATRRIALMRVVREIAMLHCQRQGHLVVHGAAFVNAEHGVLVAGAKGAGKTSLLIHALRDRCNRYVSNDRVIVAMEPDGIRLRGLPTIVSIRRHTLTMFPYLHDRFVTRPYQHTLSLEESRRKTGSKLQARTAYSLSPAQFLDLVGASPAREGQLMTLVFPRIDKSGSAIEATALSPEAAHRQLKRSLFRANLPPRVPHPFAFRELGRRTGDEDATCRRMVERIRCLDCRIGLNAYRDQLVAGFPSWAFAT